MDLREPEVRRPRVNIKVLFRVRSIRRAPGDEVVRSETDRSLVWRERIRFAGLNNAANRRGVGKQANEDPPVIARGTLFHPRDEMIGAICVDGGKSLRLRARRDSKDFAERRAIRINSARVNGAVRSRALPDGNKRRLLPAQRDRLGRDVRGENELRGESIVRPASAFQQRRGRVGFNPRQEIIRTEPNQPRRAADNGKSIRRNRETVRVQREHVHRAIR